jgi:hypothetical protein
MFLLISATPLMGVEERLHAARMSGMDKLFLAIVVFGILVLFTAAGYSPRRGSIRLPSRRPHRDHQRH